MGTNKGVVLKKKEKNEADETVQYLRDLLKKIEQVLGDELKLPAKDRFK